MAPPSEPESQTPPPSGFGAEPKPEAQSEPEANSHWGGSHWDGSQWHGPGSGPPPWWGPPRRNWRSDQRPRHRRPTWLFFRFAGVFGMIAFMILGGLALLIFFVVKAAGGDRHTAAQIWLGTCGLLLVVPFVVVRLARRAFRNIAAPLSNLMQASDRVASGDLSVRVPVAERGEFAELSSSFNHMVEELAMADRRRRNLTADVAHELRTPLQIIQGNLEGLVDGVYQPTPEHLEATLAETRLLARLVEDLRVLSQAEAGQLPMQWEAIDVGELLNDVATSFSGQAQAAAVNLAVNLVADTPGHPSTQDSASAPALRLRGDYGRLEQVLGNLLANALRHTPPGGTVTLQGGPRPQGVRLVVADTGEGIAPEDVPYVFDRFWRADRARTHSDGTGSGLGLAIARQLIQAHGGTIEVQSVLGRGTTFTIDLPSAP
ncbi:MAG: HAMP domain-containing sensor histidine kinase [Caldilineaceae bacterium]